MNKPTPGPWKIRGTSIKGGPASLVSIGGCYYGEQWHPSTSPVKTECDANVALIIAAVNSCFKVNPSNPIAAAEALPELVEACRGLQAANENYARDPCESNANYQYTERVAIRAALAKLEAKS